MTDARTLREKIAALPVMDDSETADGWNAAIERVLAILDAHQPAPDAVAEAAKVLLAVLEDPDSLPFDKHPNWQQVYDDMTADHNESMEICGCHDWPSLLTAALRALAQGQRP